MTVLEGVSRTAPEPRFCVLEGPVSRVVLWVELHLPKKDILGSPLPIAQNVILFGDTL